MALQKPAQFVISEANFLRLSQSTATYVSAAAACEASRCSTGKSLGAGAPSRCFSAGGGKLPVRAPRSAVCGDIAETSRQTAYPGVRRGGGWRGGWGMSLENVGKTIVT